MIPLIFFDGGGLSIFDEEEDGWSVSIFRLFFYKGILRLRNISLIKKRTLETIRGKLL